MPSARAPRAATEPVGVDVCVIVPNAGAVGPIRSALDGLDLTVVYVSVEAESGSQGADAVLQGLGEQLVSLTSYVLSATRHRAVLTAMPYGKVIADILADTQRSGGTPIALDVGTVDHLNDTRLFDDDGVGAEEARRALRQLGDTRTAVVAFDPLEATPPGIASIEEDPELEFDGDNLETLRDSFKGERCVIVGNGPSLNDLDLSLLVDVPFFAVNGIFYASDRLPCPPTFYVVEDNAVARENTEAIVDFEATHKLFPAPYRSKFGEGSNIHYFRMNHGFYARRSPHYCVPRFSVDAGQRVYCGQSVTIINLQLAHFFGFEEVLLIGMDFSYTIPDDADRDGDLIVSRSDDPNHFHPDYFGTGKTWKDPKLERVLASYQLAKSVYEATGRRIVNATPGGNLQVFDRIDFAAALS